MNVTDPEFMARIRASIEANQPILDRLAEFDHRPVGNKS